MRQSQVTTKLADVHILLQKLISKDTVVIGHSLDCDFRALKLVHDTVIDTSSLYPHPQGLPYKRSLKDLAKTYLHVRIQSLSGTSCSIEYVTIATMH